MGALITYLDFSVTAAGPALGEFKVELTAVSPLF